MCHQEITRANHLLLRGRVGGYVLGNGTHLSLEELLLEWFPSEHNETSLQAMVSFKAFEHIKHRLIQCSGNMVDGFYCIIF